MKKLIPLLFILTSCSEQEVNPVYTAIPKELVINQSIGIKLESNFATSEAKMNVKLEQSGEYTIKIVDISGKVVSKETVSAIAGDNLLTLHTKALPRSSYQLQLFNQYNQQIGVTVINLL
jgi:hypothetical protein